MKQEVHQLVGPTFQPWNCLVILSADDVHLRSLWEVGYQLLNLAVQAYALDIDYQLMLLDDNQRTCLADNFRISRPDARRRDGKI